MDLLESVLTWILANIVLVMIVAAAIFIGGPILLRLLGAVLERRPLRPLPVVDDQPVDGRSASDLAIGLLQIVSMKGAWNDVTARHLTDRDRAGLVRMWGIDSRESWLDKIGALRDNDRHRWDPSFEPLLDCRAAAAQKAGRKPTAQEWIAEIKASGGLDRPAKAFVASVERWEKIAHRSGPHVVLPKDVAVTTFAGYSLGQAVAIASWGVSFGFATAEEARAIITELSRETHRRFTSWEDFGRSYLLGRCAQMERLTGDAERVAGEMTDALAAYARAVDERTGGPWARLSW